MKITVGKSKRIIASESDGNYDKSFKAKGTTYYIEMLSGAGNYVAKWWDTSDNGVGYNNKGFVSLINDFNMNRGKFSPENIESLLGVMSDYDRKPSKPIQDRIKHEVAKLIDFDAINSACGKKSVKANKIVGADTGNSVSLYYNGKWQCSGFESAIADRLAIIMSRDDGAIEAIVEYCNSLGDPVVNPEYDNIERIAYTLVDIFYADWNDADSDEDAYIDIYWDGGRIEILPTSVAIKSSCSKKSVKAASSGKIPYDLVSSLVILRDWGDVGDAYINDEHKALVDIADTLYNADISPDEMSKKYKAVYDRYGKKFFDMVIDDASAIDSQISSHNVNDLVDEYNEKSEEFEHGVKASRRTVCASSFRTDFQKFLGDVDREVSDALYQYDDAVWDVKGTMSPGDDGSYWFELNLWCDGEEAGTVNIEYNGDTFLTNTDAYVVSVPDSDEIQAEGNSFADIYDTCVGELIRLAEDYVNFVR